MWISKLGNTGKPLVMALKNDGAMVSFALLGSPTLRIRRKVDPQASALEFPVTEFVDPDGEFNAQVVFTFDDLVAGDYIADVRATLGGGQVTFPSDGYIALRFLPGI